MNERRILPNRRANETFEIRHPDHRLPFQVTVGYFNDGTIGEIFVNGAKIGSQLEAVIRDEAIMVSLLLQYGTPLATIRHALTRNQDGSPSSIVGAIVDELCSTQ